MVVNEGSLHRILPQKRFGKSAKNTHAKIFYAQHYSATVSGSLKLSIPTKVGWNSVAQQWGGSGIAAMPDVEGDGEVRSSKHRARRHF